MNTKLLTICLLLFTSQVFAKEECKGKYWDNCYGTYTYASGSKYVGEYKNDMMHGQGAYTYASGDKYAGAFKNGKYHGQGAYIYTRGEKIVGQWENDKYVGK